MTPIDHPAISDPSHPDHGDWQAEFAGAPTPDEVATLTEEAQKRVDEDELARVVAAEAAAERDGTAPAESEPVEPEGTPPEPELDENGNPIEPQPVDENGQPIPVPEPWVDPNAPVTPETTPVEPAQ